jgi:hypothetical protein
LVAAEGLEERFRRDPSALDAERLKFVDYHNFRTRLEATYLVRIFAEFEAGSREAWRSSFRRTSHPRTRDLIDSLAALCRINRTWLNRVHEVRAFRNALVHEGGGDAARVGIDEARGHLCRFFSRLPHQW